MESKVGIVPPSHKLPEKSTATDDSVSLLVMYLSFTKPGGLWTQILPRQRTHLLLGPLVTGSTHQPACPRKPKASHGTTGFCAYMTSPGDFSYACNSQMPISGTGSTAAQPPGPSSQHPPCAPQGSEKRCASA